MLFFGVLSNHPKQVLYWDINSKRELWTSQDVLLNKLQQNCNIERWFSKNKTGKGINFTAKNVALTAKSFFFFASER